MFETADPGRRGTQAGKQADRHNPWNVEERSKLVNRQRAWQRLDTGRKLAAL